MSRSHSRDSSGSPDVIVDANVLGRQRTGDETHVREILSCLGRDSADLRIAAVARQAELVPEGIAGLELVPLNQAARMLWQMPRLLRRERTRLAHFQYVVPPLYRGRAVVTIHDLSYELLPELEDRFDGWALRRLVPPSVRRAERVLTVSEWTKRDIVRRYDVPEEKVVVTLNGVGREFRPEGPVPSRPGYVLFVGALRPRKDPLGALAAFADLEDLGLELVMVGPDKGLLGRVRSAIDRLGIAGRVELRGHVGIDELAALYRGADCVVLPSLYEGFGLPVVEAMASGTPVVATSVGAVPEIAGDAAVLVPPRDPIALSEGVRSALARREQLVAAGLERALRFTWEEVARRTASVYRDLLAA